MKKWLVKLNPRASILTVMCCAVLAVAGIAGSAVPVIRAAEEAGTAAETATAAGAAAEPVASESWIDELFREVLFKENPLSDQLRLRFNLTMNGEPAAEATIGWSGGAAATVSANLPLLGMKNLGLAIRPSGFVYVKAGPMEEVIAQLVAYEPYLRLVPLVFNRNLLETVLARRPYDVKLLGETEIMGRKAYVLQLTVRMGALPDLIKGVLNQLAGDSATAQALAEVGLPVEGVLQGLDAVFPAFSKVMAEAPSPIVRWYVDVLDHVTLGHEVDDAAFNEWLAKMSSSSEQEGKPALAAPPAPAPELKLEDLVVGEDGHIRQLIWRTQVDLPVGAIAPFFFPGSGKGEGAPVPAPGTESPTTDTMDSMIASHADLRLTTSAVDGYYLPTEVTGVVRINPAVVALLLGAREGEGWIMPPAGEPGAPVPEALEYPFRLTLDWNFSQGADPALLENAKLVEGEQAWAQVQKALAAGDDRALIAPLARLVRLAPSFVYAHQLLSDAYYNTGETWAAVAELEQVVMLQPDNGWALNNLAYMYVDHDLDWERGLELAEQAYALLENEPAVADTLGWAYYKNGRLEEAAAKLEEAVKLLEENDTATEEDHAILNYHLAAVYAAQGRYAEARAKLEISLELQPDLEEARALLEEVVENLKAKGQ
ncbi:MAG TPA: tetratricopeptide repeat protein [Firmicutes bacterium]|nr:tetratricopeptide repeat protein [Bacillota bacterium]